MCSNDNESGRFLTDGITQTSATNSTFVQCTSTHLTSFAVLVDVSGETVSQLMQKYIVKHLYAEIISSIYNHATI